MSISCCQGTPDINTALIWVIGQRIVMLTCIIMPDCADFLLQQAPWELIVKAAMTSAALRTGDTALHVGRHFSLRDAMKWARRMQVSFLCPTHPFPSLSHFLCSCLLPHTLRLQIW